MDVRQVVLGAAFGAAVAVNAALQSLEDAGSFLIRSPSRTSPLALLNASRSRKRALSFSAVQDGEEIFGGREDDDDDRASDGSDADDDLLPFDSRNPLIDTSAGLAEALSSFKNSGATVLHERNSQMNTTQAFHKGSLSWKPRDEEKCSNGGLQTKWEPSNIPQTVQKRRKVQAPVFLPLLPEMIQTEEAMCAMLRHTTNTVLETLVEAQRRRDRMILELGDANLPERENSLKLVISFIDALINVSDSLKFVQLALFVNKDDPPTQN